MVRAERSSDERAGVPAPDAGGLLNRAVRVHRAGQAAHERPCRGGSMTPREKPTESRESPKMNTSGMLKLFVYGTLKHGYWNHHAFCRGVLEVREAQVRGRLYEGPGFPVLEVPDEDVLARGTADPLADVTTQGRLSDQVGSSSPVPDQEGVTAGTWGAVYGELLTFQPQIPPACHRPPGGVPSGRFQPLPAGARPGHGGRRLRAGLGLHGRDDPHQTPPDRVRPLAGVTADGWNEDSGANT